MTEEEVKKLVYVIQMSFPKYYATYTKEQTEVMIGLWARVLDGYTYEQANAGYIIYMRKDKEGFPPAPGQIIDSINDIVSYIKLGIDWSGLIPETIKAAVSSIFPDVKSLPHG